MAAADNTNGNYILTLLKTAEKNALKLKLAHKAAINPCKNGPFGAPM
jgi:hypothetical protein